VQNLVPFLAHLRYIVARERQHRFGFPIALILGPLFGLARGTQMPVHFEVEPVVLPEW
jgi:hypothetical protein